MLKFLQRHAVGLTMLWVVVFALVLSVLPIPSEFKPFPALVEKPEETIWVAVWPRAKAKPVTPPESALPDDPDKEVVLPEFDLSNSDSKAPSVARGLTYEDERDGQKWEQVVKKVQAVHVDIEQPCLERNEQGGCTRFGLDPFFRALEDAEKTNAGKPVRVMVLGTSLIASDHITDVARKRLLARHGAGGLGYMFIDRPTRNAGREVRTGKATPGWNIFKLTDDKYDTRLGMAGVAFVAPADGSQSSTWNVAGQKSAEIFMAVQPQGGEIEVRVDGAVKAQLSTASDQLRPATARIELPAGAKRMELKTRSGPVRVDGVSFETGLSGAVLDTLGLPGGTAGVWLRANDEMFGLQMLHRKPALVVLMMGGNEAFDLSRNRYTPAQARKNFVTLIDRVRRYAPQAALLIASPPDAGVWRMDKTIAPRKETAVVSKFLHEVAQEKQVALWDMQAAMGGEGAIERWWNAGLMNEDLVHPIGVGGDVFGYLFDSALERARQQFQSQTPPPQVQRRWRSPAARTWLLGATPSGASEEKRPRASTRSKSGNKSNASKMRSAGAGDEAAAADSTYCPPDAGTDDNRPIKFAKWPSGPGLSSSEHLIPFFERLQLLETSRHGRVAILQLGASHTAAQFFTDAARFRLADRFGYAGRGYVAVGPPYERLERSGVERNLEGSWTLLDAMKWKTLGERWGLTGIRAIARPGASARFDFTEPFATDDDIARLQVFMVEEPQMGTFRVYLDDRLEKTVTAADQKGPARVRVLELGTSGSRHSVRLENEGPGDVSVLGVAHELIRPGIIYDALGLPGSTAVTFSNYESVSLVTQLQARQPDLYILFYGTNEAALPPAELEEVRAAYPQIISNLRRASPYASCLFLGPTDRMSKKKSLVWQETQSLNTVYELLRDVAAKNRCAFWETRAAMGGEGSIDKWRKTKPPLANKDHVHLTPEGYRRLANELVDDLVDAYELWRTRRISPGGSPP